ENRCSPCRHLAWGCRHADDLYADGAHDISPPPSRVRAGEEPIGLEGGTAPWRGPLEEVLRRRPYFRRRRIVVSLQKDLRDDLREFFEAPDRLSDRSVDDLVDCLEIPREVRSLLILREIDKQVERRRQCHS